MRYIRSERSFRQYQPKKSWSIRGWLSRSRRKVTAREFPTHAALAPRLRRETNRLTHLRALAPKALPILILLWLGLLVYLPYFKVTDLSITGLSILSSEEVENQLRERFFTGSIWPRNNYFLLSKSKISKFLSKQYKFNSIEIKKIFPHHLEINITEKIPAMIYDNGQSYYLVDGEGVAFQKIMDVAVGSAEAGFASSTLEGVSSTLQLVSHVPDYASIRLRFGRYPIVHLTSASVSTTRDAALTNVVLKPEVIEGIIGLTKRLEEGRVAVPHYITMENPLAGATLYTNQPWKILFQPLFDSTDQVNKIKTILKTNRPTEYIDVRLGSRVFWK